MNKRFLKLYESTIGRYNRGGFLVSDIVTFAKNALKNDFLKTQNEDVAARIKEYIESGDTLRVINIVNNAPPVMGANNTDDGGPDFTIEVGKETAPGRFETSGILVHPTMLVRVDAYPNLTPVPDKVKRKEKIDIKPVAVKDEEGEEVPFYTPKLNTRRSDVHGKMEAGDRVLNNVNVKIPSGTNAIDKDPASYTARYLPKA